jgi:hypothetical protein
MGAPGGGRFDPRIFRNPHFWIVAGLIFGSNMIADFVSTHWPTKFGFPSEITAAGLIAGLAYMFFCIWKGRL